MNRLIKLFLISALFLTATPLLSQAAETGLVDEARLLSEYKESKDAQGKITELRTKIQNLLVDLNNELEKASTDKTLSEAQKTQKQKEAEKKLIDEKNKAEVVANDLREKVEAAVQQAINEEAKAQGLSLILTKDAALYGGKDITDALLKRLNK